MVKNISKSNYFKDLLSLFRVFYNVSEFKKEKNFFSLVSYSIIILILLSIVVFLSGSATYLNFSSFDGLQSFFIVFVITLVIFTLFYVFVSAFDGNKKNKKFWKSFFVFSSVVLSFLLVVNLLRYLLYLSSGFVYNLLFLFLVIIWIWFTFMLVFGLKNYFDTTLVKIIASWLLIIFFIYFVLVVYYVSMLLSLNSLPNFLL